MIKKTISLVIPCLNEQEAVGDVLSQVQSVREHMLEHGGFTSVQVLVLDDGSTDNSLIEIQKFPFVEIHKNEKTLGYGTSLKKGFATCHGQWICFFDMDSSYPVEQIPHMCEWLESKNLDVVLGKRSFVAQGMSLTRGVGNWLYTRLTKAVFRSQIHDACTGFRIFTRECLPDILSIEENSLGFSLAMSIQSTLLGHRTADYAISYHPRKGESKLTVWNDGWLFLSLIFLAAFRKLNRAKPNILKNQV